ncbi:hypothetical protein M4D55_19150 [Metabacillus idriensis]|uniref:Uncharacterized protein n=1 Tax=Metabacillus idriensis TaxID=324768 RepID=A0A6I2MDG0_9BACI|nr:hypothetical protein [Metabacillus idriensis]MCM3597890.1 hypothetical protein [Metabacillus idriensis]MRX56375.1 hypothetical protein [Metabacillus idriensis]
MIQGLKIFSITFAALAAITTIGFATMFFLNQDYTKERNQEENEPISAATSDEPAEQPVQDYGNTENPEYQDAGEFIADFHAFYNETTGWDRIDSLNMADQTARATAAKAYAAHFVPLVEDEALKTDLESIIRHSESVIYGNSENVQTLHRYFHDLDMVINGYVHEDFFGVVESE